MNNEFGEFRQVVTSALMEQIDINSTVQGSLDELTEASKCLNRGMDLTAKTLKNIMDILEKQEAEIQILKAYIAIKEGGEWK